MKGLGPSVVRSLLTIDEARVVLTTSATRCLRNADCDPFTLVAMLWGLPVGETGNDRLLSEEHRTVLEWISDSGHGWILAEELSGIVSATGLCDGERMNVDSIAAQLPDSGLGDTDGDILE